MLLGACPLKPCPFWFSYPSSSCRCKHYFYLHRVKNPEVASYVALYFVGRSFMVCICQMLFIKLILIWKRKKRKCYLYWSRRQEFCQQSCQTFDILYFVWITYCISMWDHVHFNTFWRWFTGDAFFFKLTNDIRSVCHPGLFPRFVAFEPKDITATIFSPSIHAVRWWTDGL